ncbi:PEP-CTERM sorting domain-containing protein [Tundrisphaera lichenicola]|uniref:PEP-CTERM sorting domain-containing protein n=1 Tax=Tundrisphaera lichenicola TaxID=2029860 RepID=UPI003EBEDB0B
MRKPLTLFAVLLAAVAWLDPNDEARADFIVNGGFETEDFTGWTLSGNTSDPTTFGVDSSIPHSGGFAAYFGPQSSKVFLEQTVATVVGEEYTLSFFLMNEDGSSPNAFSVEFGSMSLADSTDLSTFDYQMFTYKSIATFSTTIVRFGFQNDFAYFDIDNISLVRAVPEPGTLASLAIGVALLGCHRWMRRSARRVD